MGDESRAAEGEALAAEVRAELEHLGLGRLRALYVPEKHVVRVTWLHLDGNDATEGVEFIASREWVERMRPVFMSVSHLRDKS